MTAQNSLRLSEMNDMVGPNTSKNDQVKMQNGQFVQLSNMKRRTQSTMQDNDIPEVKSASRDNSSLRCQEELQRLQPPYIN